MSSAGWQTHPATASRFDDLADVINPRRRTSHCWCLSHRLTRQGVTRHLLDGAVTYAASRGAPAVEGLG